MLFAIPPATATAQPAIVLRNLTLVRNKTIKDFSGWSIELSDGSSLRWDEVRSAQVDVESQTAFDKKLRSIGLPLFRLKTRLKNRDWNAVRELAEPLYTKLDLNGLESDGSLTSYMICVATMKGRLADGDRAGAVLPFLQAATTQNGWADATKARIEVAEFALPISESNASQAFSDELLPVWFEGESVPAAFKQLSTSFVPTATTKETGALIYLASMAIKMKRLDLADELIGILKQRSEVPVDWQVILLAQLQIAQNKTGTAARLIKEHKFEFPQAEATGHLLQATALLEKLSIEQNGKSNIDYDEATDAMLSLLKVSAFSGQKTPSLSAAALYQSAQIAKSMDWDQEEKILHHELRRRYSKTYFGRLLEKNRTASEN